MLSPHTASIDGVMICPVPSAPRLTLPYPLQSLMQYALPECAISGLTWAFASDASYEKSCNRETTQFIKQMWLIAQDAEKSLEEKALLLHAFAAYGLASRPITPYAVDQKQIPLPVYREGRLSIESCVLLKECFLATVPVRIFAPVDGFGSPTYTFPPTGAWPKAQGMAVQILDDLNPLGPGTALQHLAVKEFPPFLHELLEKYKEKACFVGLSLGGILATSIALELPDLVGYVCAFSPSRPFPALVKKWEELQASKGIDQLPQIHTYIPQWINGQDPITLFGGEWIGTVHRIYHQASNNPIERHIAFFIPDSPRALHQEVCQQQRPAIYVTLLIAMHRVFVTCFLLIGLLFLSLKRLLVGYKQGTYLRYGLFGLPYMLYKAAKRRANS